MDTRVRVAVAPVELEVLTRHSRSVTCDVELDAGGVELRAASWVLVEGGVCLVQGNDFLADCGSIVSDDSSTHRYQVDRKLTDVLPSLDVTWDGEVLLALVGNQLVHRPLAAVEAILVDLCPDRRGSSVLEIRSNVCDDCTLVR